MPNFKVFNDPSDPLNSGVLGQKPDGSWQVIRSNNNNSLVGTEQAELYTRLGEFYNLTTGSQTTTPNGFLVVQVTNSAGTGKALHLSELVGGSITNTTFDLIMNGTFASSGTAIVPQNRNSGFANASIATAKWISQSTDPTTGGTLASSLVQIGGAVAISYGGTWIIAPNSTLAIRLVNNSTLENLLSISIAWWEEPI